MNKEIQQLVQSGSIYSVWHKPKIEEFINKNGIRVQGCYDKLKEIFDRCHELDENNNPVLFGEGDDKKPKLKEFVTEEGYNKERSEYLNELIEVSL